MERVMESVYGLCTLCWGYEGIGWRGLNLTKVHCKHL
jgi:hypothetical protein